MKALMIFCLVVTGVAFPEDVSAGIIKKVKKEVERKVKPRVRPETWRAPSPPIKTPSESPIVADSNPYQQCRATVMPSFISRSMTMGKTTNRALKALSPPSIVVNGAGNSYPQPVSTALTKASRDFNAIVVGSMSPEGVKSGFSQEGEAVHIMAPSDHYLTSATSTGHYRKYGGTSGATPLVTGSLAGFEWMAGYHPTAKEAKIVLAKTAIPTPYSKDKPRKNGVGMVNAYKLAMVGKKLKQACGNNIACFKDRLRKDDIYQFPEDKAVSEAFNRAFPHCSATCTAEDLKTEPSCADKAKAFKDLRKQAFLNPHNKELWKQVACVYAQGGFRENKAFALNIYNTLSGRPKRDSGGRSGGGGGHRTYCQKDTDCTLVKPCPGLAKPPYHLVAMNKTSAEYHYLNCIGENGTIPLCNGKCRCNPKEEQVVEQVQVLVPTTGGGGSTTGGGGSSDGGGSTTDGGGSSDGGGSTTDVKTRYNVSCVQFQCVVHQAMPPVTENPVAVEPSQPSPPASTSGGSGSAR